MPFDFFAAATIDEAIGALADAAGDARIVAGGTDLVVQCRDRRIAPDRVVSLHRIGGLNGIVADGDLRIGPLVTATRVAREAAIQRRYPALAEGARLVGAWLIQNRATLAGNICNASPAADTIPALLVHGARVRLRGPNGERDVPLEAFLTGPGRTVRDRAEVLTEIVLPPPAGRSGSAYVKLSPRGAMDIAIVGVAARVDLDPAGERIAAATIALGAVAPTPIRVPAAEELLAGQPIATAPIAEAARAARAAVRPIDDLRGSAAYRSEMVEALVDRVVRQAIERAGR